MEIRFASLLVVILSRADGEGPLRRSKRERMMRGSSVRAGLALSARVGMTGFGTRDS
jgi:hypothetical protein